MRVFVGGGGETDICTIFDLNRWIKLNIYVCSLQNRSNNYDLIITRLSFGTNLMTASFFINFCTISEMLGFKLKRRAGKRSPRPEFNSTGI